MYHNTFGDSSPAPTTLLDTQRAMLRQLRSAILQRYRPHLQEGAGPIRVMARIVSELEQECRKRNIEEEVIRSEIMNRTIGDVNLRLVTEYEGEMGGPGDYRRLADEMGVALPNEQLCNYIATGETYLWLRAQMMECERLLLANRYDPRMYDIYGTGNPLLRSWLACEMQQWGISVQVEQVYLGLGAMDSIDKVLRGLMHIYRAQGIADVAVLFPEPGFLVPEWQARSYGYRIHSYPTLPEHRFKLTGEQLDQILQANPDIRIIYLMVTNNPTTFAYTPDELNAIHAVLEKYRSSGRTIHTLADLAYIGTGKPEEDRARMATFTPPDIVQQTIFVCSFSKTHSLTGERFGWVTCGDPHIASEIAVCWANSMASLPGEWQLRFMAYYRLLQERPWLAEKMRAFYRFRRTRLIEQLRQLNETTHLFAEIYIDDDATVYNWSKLQAGEDALSVFEQIGIAGVPGSGFGYSDDYIRFSVGVIPIP
ncbi:MAG TPA: pyridoxal phosphate-dependent aminotransferase [Ktedonobacteraceae bacterium]